MPKRFTNDPPNHPLSFTQGGDLNYVNSNTPERARDKPVDISSQWIQTAFGKKRSSTREKICRSTKQMVIHCEDRKNHAKHVCVDHIILIWTF